MAQNTAGWILLPAKLIKEYIPVFLKLNLPSGFNRPGRGQFKLVSLENISHAQPNMKLPGIT